MSVHSLTGLIRSYPAYSAGAALVAVALLGLAVWGAVRTIRRRSSAGIAFATLGAIVATLVSTNNSWRFFGDHLGMTSPVERSVTFAVGEIALFACALLARENLLAEHEDPGTPATAGTPGVLVWVISGAACVPAFAEGHGLAGVIVRCLFGPLGAAVLWHQALGVELRAARGEGSGGMLATIARQVRERVMARLGMAEADRDAVRIAHDRAIARAVELIDALSAFPADSTGRRRTRLNASLRKAIRTSGVATDPAARDALLAQVAASRHASALATIDLVSPWDAPASGAARDAAGTRPAPVARRIPAPHPDSHRDAVRMQVREVAERYRARQGAYPSARKLAELAKVRQGTASAVLTELNTEAAATVLTVANGHDPAAHAA